MRDATAALALDPALAGAAELVGRLMLEPPRESPPEVEDALAEDDIRTAHSIARAGLLAVIGGLLFTPLVWWIAGGADQWIVAIIALLAVDGGIAIYSARTRAPKPGLVIVGNSILVVALSRAFSPILIAPGVAAVLAMAMVMTPRFSRLSSAIAISASLAAAVLAPWLLELTGVLPSTMTTEHGAVTLRGPLLGGTNVATMVVGVVYTAALIAGACAMGDAMRTRTRDALRRLQLQAWQLGQLVPR